MSVRDLPPPFRWDIARREQLGDLLSGPEIETYAGFDADLHLACAKLFARSDGCDLVFVGRSAENFFDYLSGLFEDLTEAPRLTLLPFSDPGGSVDSLVRHHRGDLEALLAQFERLRLDPKSIASDRRQIRFADFVASGSTFATLFALLELWSGWQSVEWKRVVDHIGFLGVTMRGKNSPNAWRWQQHHAWVAALRKAHVKNVSVPRGFWSWIANHDDKTMPSFRMQRWSMPEAAEPDRHERHLRGMRFAVKLYNNGLQRAERVRFAETLSAQPEMKDAWLRTIVLQLRRR